MTGLTLFVDLAYQSLIINWHCHTHYYIYLCSFAHHKCNKSSYINVFSAISVRKTFFITMFFGRWCSLSSSCIIAHLIVPTSRSKHTWIERHTFGNRLPSYLIYFLWYKSSCRVCFALHTDKSIFKVSNSLPVKLIALPKLVASAETHLFSKSIEADLGRCPTMHDGSQCNTSEPQVKKTLAAKQAS